MFGSSSNFEVFFNLHNFVFQFTIFFSNIFSRDKTDLDTILSKEKLDIILKCAGLDVPKKQYIENTGLLIYNYFIFTIKKYFHLKVQKFILLQLPLRDRNYCVILYSIVSKYKK